MGRSQRRTANSSPLATKNPSLFPSLVAVDFRFVAAYPANFFPPKKVCHRVRHWFRRCWRRHFIIPLSNTQRRAEIRQPDCPCTSWNSLISLIPSQILSLFGLFFVVWTGEKDCPCTSWNSPKPEKLTDRVTRCNPKVYDGMFDTIELVEWIQQMAKIFSAVEVRK